MTVRVRIFFVTFWALIIVWAVHEQKKVAKFAENKPAQ